MKVSEEQRNLYLNISLVFSDKEKAKVEFYGEWLPEKVIDAHAHCNLQEHVGQITMKAFNHMMTTFPNFSIDESESVNRLLYPKTTVKSLRFPAVFGGVDYRMANEYILQNSQDNDRVATFGPADDLGYLEEKLYCSNPAALKMYYSYSDPSAKTIYETFPKKIVSTAEETGTPMIIHLPTSITSCVNEILDLKQDFPDSKVTIAHLGSTKFDSPELHKVYDSVAKETDFMMDTALNPSVEVCARALNALGPDRIMFGSDAPLNLIRSVSFVHPEKGQRIVADMKYHWQDQTEYDEYHQLAKGAVHSHWLALDALRSAISGTYSGAEETVVKQNIFHEALLHNLPIKSE